MTLNIKHRHVELTEAIKAYVEKKMHALTKFADLVSHADVEVGKESEHHKNGKVFICKAVLELKDGQVIRIDREADDLYKAIDKVYDHAKQQLTEIHRLQIDRDAAA